MLSRKSVFLTALIFVAQSTVLVGGAGSADFDFNECIKNQLTYRVNGYTAVSPEQLKLDPREPSKLMERVRNAFLKEAEKVDSTALPISEIDKLPHYAMTKALIDPTESGVAKILAIRNAKHDILLGTYILGKDDFSYAVMNELKDALGRGVNVRLLIDGEGSAGVAKDMLRALKDVPKGRVIDDFGNATDKLAEVAISVFNPPSRVGRLVAKLSATLGPEAKKADSGWARIFRQLAHRMHTKILAVDADYPEGIAFVGGRNTDGLYNAYPKLDKDTYNDTEIIIRNDPDHFQPEKKSIASTVAREFRKLEGHALNSEVTGLLTGDHFDPFNRAAARYNKQIEKMGKASAEMWRPGGEYEKVLKRMQDERFLETDFDSPETRLLTQIHNINRADVWTHVDHSGAYNPLSITRSLHKLMNEADKSVTFVTPYLNLTRTERRLMIRKLLDDPEFKVTIVTNSLYSGDNIITQYVVDKILIPQLKQEARDAALKKGMSAAEAEIFVDRIKIHALGKLDGVEYGGDQFYGKLHAKYAIFESKDPSKTVTVVGSYNGDNISRLHNSEVAIAMKGAPLTTQGFMDKTADLISKSYLWGSEEWQKVRDGKPLRLKRIAEKVVSRVEWLIDPIE